MLSELAFFEGTAQPGFSAGMEDSLGPFRNNKFYRIGGIFTSRFWVTVASLSVSFSAGYGRFERQKMGDCRRTADICFA
jgi:hypothetical protein